MGKLVHLEFRKDLL